MLNKVPLVTLYFWVIKIMATTVGETAADFLNTNLNLGLTNTSFVMGALLIAALVLQFRKDRYVPWIYWVSVVLISVVGTLITDNLTDHFGIALQTTTTIFALALASTFAVWYSVERTLSIHTIFTTRRELFYWAAILFTFALGTAAGDLLAEQLKLGYLHSAMVFGAGIGLTFAAYRLFRLNAVVAFWIAYILTRPFGASFGDLLSQPRTNGGLGLGTVGTSALFLAVILGLIVVMTKAQMRAGASVEPARVEPR
ncbi:COG4705 family protein [Piscinibacter defluvii]|uniref:COG4705 family protein n=1 Tax=Piscinibacter defluvii TaxID=1796922 RepID=UPI000FDD3D1A